MQRFSDEAMTHATELGLGLYVAAGAVHQGCLKSHRGQFDEGLADMQRGVTVALNLGADLRVCGFLAWMADAELKAGRHERARTHIADGLRLASRTEQHYWDAELHRLNGLALEGADAEASLLLALEIARDQQARSLELRAAMDLSRLRMRQGRARDASAVLSGIHGWFAEGLQTPDLVDAKRLLAEMH